MSRESLGMFLLLSMQKYSQGGREDDCPPSPHPPRVNTFEDTPGLLGLRRPHSGPETNMYITGFRILFPVYTFHFLLRS